MEKVLLVEDDPDAQALAARALAGRCQIVNAGTIEEARAFLKTNRPELILLDVSLPDGDGFRYCAELRSATETREIPVILLTARSAMTDKVLGFSLGADDYIGKPYDQLELRARVEAKLARVRERRESQASVVKGLLKIDLTAQRAYLTGNAHDEELQLTPLEFKILVHLARNEGRVVSREQLFEGVWGSSTHVYERATDKHISSLRKKLTEKAPYIETVAGTGYRFTVPR